MAEVTFETTVQKTVIEVEDMTGTPVNVEEDEDEETPETEEIPKAEEEPKTDRFETEEFKSELKEIGFTDAQIERLYKSGALKAIAAMNLDDIDDEGEEDHE